MAASDEPNRGAAIARGMRDAKAAGKTIGRPMSKHEDEIAALLGAGWSAERVRKHLKVGTTAVQRVRRKIRSGQGCGP